MSLPDRKLDFRSDNIAGIAPEILAALRDTNEGADSPYGEDETSRRITDAFSAVFDMAVEVFPVATGTAANSLALSTIMPQWGSIVCHEEAHILTSECGAPEFFAGGGKLTAFAGADGKIKGKVLGEWLARQKPRVHHNTVSGISIAQTTEVGTLYTPEQIAALGDVCRDHTLKLHMDGARFANAVAALGCTPADISWRAGVDVLSLGLTKDGAFAAEAVIFFDRDLARDFAYRRKRGGHLFSKMRFIAAQFDALLKDALWLRLAGHANAMARYLAERLSVIRGVELLFPVEANALFVRAPETAISSLERSGYRFHRRQLQDGSCIRLMTAFDTQKGHLDAFAAAMKIAIQNGPKAS